MKSLTVDVFDIKSIVAAIEEIKIISRKLDPDFLANTVVKQVADVGLKQATEGFNSAAYAGYEVPIVSLFKTEKGWCITAMGEQAAYIEYGAGVFGNPISYKGYKPPEIDDLGTHDTRHGTNVSLGIYKEWYYKKGGQKFVTQGIMARQAMYYALQDMKEAAPGIFKSWFEDSEEW